VFYSETHDVVVFLANLTFLIFKVVYLAKIFKSLPACDFKHLKYGHEDEHDAKFEKLIFSSFL